MPFQISLTHDTFEAGTSITGTIDITSHEAISAKALCLTFKGEERTRCIDPDSKESAEAVCGLHSMRQDLSSSIIQGGRRIKAGKHRVPFEMFVPEGLPQTVSIPHTRVTYFVGFELEDRKGRVVEKGETTVNILAEKLVHHPCPYHREPFLEFVKKNRFKKGHFVITTTIQDTVLEPGEVVGVSVAVRNRSPLKIKKVKIMLKQHTHATAVNNEREGERILTFHEFKEYRKMKRKRKKWLRGTDEQEDFDDVQEELDSEEHDGELRVPKNATLTYDGRLFDVKHDLYILIQTDQKDDIEIRLIPIELIRKEPKKEFREEDEDEEDSDSSGIV
mmetsp:Transcript_20738/g.34305  ORF Transcript_20738/g.34305 Transcript_20738/m.34305 type:complete len:333 (-) Transcript_20738:61-1059(-)|eukprot:CAMPEP_0119010594 /NCGR_PEP_ID=MMETSP1176-20130426/5116_1 /TAXON_ID=265551 /ORGANISM="Synedropsis recta cf, Strain CCMP1620" /LENGTH=332 /DNA_ID=CAMNT_0006963287 /DNA_START=145 /DNA_END=1143 /DNA_ORIENTATION=+